MSSWLLLSSHFYFSYKEERFSVACRGGFSLAERELRSCLIIHDFPLAFSLKVFTITVATEYRIKKRKDISGGVKILILVAFNQSGKIFNASASGNNYTKWIAKLEQEKDLTIKER